MKKLLMVFAGVVSAMLAGAETVEYWDPVAGTTKTADATVVTESTDTFVDGGWYVVKGEVSRGKIMVNGSANLILADEAELTINGVNYQAGIEVANGNALTIWGQKKGSGYLEATGGSDGAGIGGGYIGNGGNVTISGGTVVAVGGWMSAGIGGGNGGAGGTVTIDGGIVTAIGDMRGAGIGGGQNGVGGDVTINGGVVTAEGKDGGKGIGGGWGVNGGTLTINGGTVNATGWNGFSGDALTLNGGSIKASSNNDGSDAIGGQPKNKADANVYCVTVETVSGEAAIRDLPEYYGTNNIKSIGGRIYLYLPDGEYTIFVNGAWYFAKVKGIGVTAEKLNPLIDSVEYCDADGNTHAAANVVKIESGMRPLLGGGAWYTIEDSVDLGSITVVGEANIILADNKKLTVSGGDWQAGIMVTDGNTLKIWAQTLGTGELVANGGYMGAGIGGGHLANGGTVEINGGIVKATGGGDWDSNGAAGIGGGCGGAGGNITINGGVVTAVGMNGAGIGSGNGSGEGYSNVTINGGVVTATGGTSGAGIGGNVYGCAVTINGGTVTANGGTYGAGIGGGAPVCDVTINGGVVTAQGKDGGAGIGGNFNKNGGNVTINGGVVTAIGGQSADGDGAGIGGGGWISTKDGTVMLDETKVVVVEGGTGKGYGYIKIIKKPTCEGGTVERGEGGVWIVTPTGVEVTIAGLPEGAWVALDIAAVAAESSFKVQLSEPTAKLRWADVEGASPKYLAYSDEQGFTVKSGTPANATAANPFTSYGSYVLGLDPTDEHSSPFLAAIPTDLTDWIAFSLGGIKPRLDIGATITCAVEYADNLDFTGSSQTEPVAIGKPEDNVITVPIPTREDDSAVRFFRARIRVDD